MVVVGVRKLQRRMGMITTNVRGEFEARRGKKGTAKIEMYDD